MGTLQFFSIKCEEEKANFDDEDQLIEHFEQDVIP